MEYDNIHIVMSFLLDDTSFLTDPEAEIGQTVHNVDQAKAVQNVSQLLYVILNEVGHYASDDKYIESFLWKEVMCQRRARLLNRLRLNLAMRRGFGRSTNLKNPRESRF